MIAHSKVNDILNVDSKRRLLEGLKQIPDMFAVVYILYTSAKQYILYFIVV